PTDSSQDVIVIFLGGTNPGALRVAWANWVGSLGQQRGFDATQGIWIARMTGPTISTGTTGGNGFVFCPDLNTPNGALVQLDKLNPAGPTIYKLLVPDDRRNGIWTWTTETLRKASSGPNQPSDWGINQTWSKWQYAATAKCFLVCDTEGMKMRMFRPTGL